MGQGIGGRRECNENVALPINTFASTRSAIESVRAAYPSWTYDVSGVALGRATLAAKRLRILFLILLVLSSLDESTNM